MRTCDRAPRHARPRRVRPAPEAGPGGARRVPGPRDDQRLAPVAPRGPVRGAAQHDPAGAGRARPPGDLERRLLLRRRGVHDRRDRPRVDPERRASRSTAPTSTSAWSPAPARAASPPRMPGPSPQGAAQRYFEPRRTAAGRPSPSCKRMVRFETGDLLRMAVPTARYDVVICRNTVIYFTEEVRDALHERLVKALSPRRLPRRRHLRARRRPARARPHLALPLHLPEELNGSPSTSRCSSPRAASTSGAQPRGRPDRGEPDDPDDGRRDLPHRALAEGHERDDGLRRHGGAHARDGGRLRAAAPAQGRAGARRHRRALRVPGRAVGRGRVDRRRPARRRSSRRR